MPRDLAARRVAVFTRVPILGDVKTRLAEEIGSESALSCYVQLLRGTLDAVSQWDAEIWYEGVLADRSWTDGLPVNPQPDGDLGERMFAAFSNGCRLLLGCDCPIVNEDYIQHAFEALQLHDVVLGPVEDGGYFLIAMNHPHRELFAIHSWGSNTVTDQTIKQAVGLGLSITCLPTLWDVDTVEDYRRWQKIVGKSLSNSAHN